jgi:hypothetical protein
LFAHAPGRRWSGFFIFIHSLGLLLSGKPPGASVFNTNDMGNYNRVLKSFYPFFPAFVGGAGGKAFAGI